MGLYSGTSCLTAYETITRVGGHVRMIVTDENMEPGELTGQETISEL